MGKPKILYLITKSNWGGAQKYVYDLALEAQRRNFEVAVALGGEGELLTHLKQVNIRTIPLPNVKRDIQFLGEFNNLWQLIKLFKAERPDIIHLNSSKIGGLGALAGRLVGIKKIIFTAHGLPFREKRDFIWRAFAYLGTWVTILFSTKTIGVSKYDLDQARRMPLCKRKVISIHNGIGQLNFLTQAEARQQLDLSTGDTIIGSIGELTANKHYSALVQVVSKLKERNHQLKLAIIGEGEEREKLTSDNVKLLGHKFDAYKYLPAFDIFVLPSLKEGLPYVLLEAGLAGLPVVATKVGGVPEIIESGQSGLLVAPGNNKELALAIEKLLTNQDLAKHFGQVLKEKITSHFSPAQMLNQTFTLYEK